MKVLKIFLTSFFSYFPLFFNSSLPFSFPFLIPYFLYYIFTLFHSLFMFILSHFFLSSFLPSSFLQSYTLTNTSKSYNLHILPGFPIVVIPFARIHCCETTARNSCGPSSKSEEHTGYSIILPPRFAHIHRYNRLLFTP